MNLPKNYVLKPWQRDDPLVWRADVPVPFGGFVTKTFSLDLLASVLGFSSQPGSRLQTWQRDESNPDGPHWIGVKKGTPMHVDPKYPRYTHQLVVYNDGWGLTGLARRTNPPLTVGTVFCADTHSPHQLVPDTRVGTGSYYLAASMDSKTLLNMAVVVSMLRLFVDTQRAAYENVPQSERSRSGPGENPPGV